MGNLRNVLLGLLLLVSIPASAADVNCHGATNIEEFRYSWRLRGGLSWIAGLVFPTSGVGNLKTVYPTGADNSINSELLITTNEGTSGGFFVYESEMDGSGAKTLMTYHGYS